MSEPGLIHIPVTRLRVGMFIELDLDWMSHPFSLNRFKLRSQSQIETLLAIGVETVRYDPSRSDVPPLDEEAAATPPAITESVQLRKAVDQQIAGKLTALSDEAINRQQLEILEKKYAESCRIFRVMSKEVLAQPEKARDKAIQISQHLLDQVQSEQLSIRLLADRTGEEFTLHHMNVAVLGTLLGKQIGLSDTALMAVATASLVHDMGKLILPDRLRFHNQHLSAAEKSLLKEHVAKGVELGKQMGLDPAVLLAIGQHHELADGAGYPLGINVHRMSTESKVVALINRYDNLCNTGVMSESLTPHEALRTIFATCRHEFDEGLLAAFVKLMGIYPPGSIIKLTDDRIAMVISVNPKQPLRPVVQIYDEKTTKERAPILNLEQVPELSIRQAIKPSLLPKPVFEYLSPRRQLVYFIQSQEAEPVAGG